MNKVIGIVGTRRRNTPRDYGKVKHRVQKLYAPGDKLCSGGCKTGADSFVERIALELDIPESDIIIYLPQYKKYGRIATFMRNAQIAKKSDVLIAVVAKDRTGGTEDTIKKFRRLHGKEPILV